LALVAATDGVARETGVLLVRMGAAGARAANPASARRDAAPVEMAGAIRTAGARLTGRVRRQPDPRGRSRTRPSLSSAFWMPANGILEEHGRFAQCLLSPQIVWRACAF